MKRTLVLLAAVCAAMMSFADAENAAPRLKLALTFDDGFRNHLTEVAPLLEKYHMPAAFSVITDVVDRHEKPFRMCWDEVRALHAKGFEIFSHSTSHPNLPRLLRAHEGAKAEYEITNSYARIKAEVGVAPKVFCLPFNATNGRVNAMIRKAGMIPMQAKRTNFGEGTYTGGKADINAHIDKLLAAGVKADALMIHGIRCEGDKVHRPFKDAAHFERFLQALKARAPEVVVVPYMDIAEEVAPH